MLKFVPAGVAGRYKVNDTQWHNPLKDEARAMAAVWYQEHIFFAGAGALSQYMHEAKVVTGICMRLKKKFLFLSRTLGTF